MSFLSDIQRAFGRREPTGVRAHPDAKLTVTAEVYNKRVALNEDASRLQVAGATARRGNPTTTPS